MIRRQPSTNFKRQHRKSLEVYISSQISYVHCNKQLLQYINDVLYATEVHISDIYTLYLFPSIERYIGDMHDMHTSMTHTLFKNLHTIENYTFLYWTVPAIEVYISKCYINRNI